MVYEVIAGIRTHMVDGGWLMVRWCGLLPLDVMQPIKNQQSRMLFLEQRKAYLNKQVPTLKAYDFRAFLHLTFTHESHVCLPDELVLISVLSSWKTSYLFVKSLCG